MNKMNKKNLLVLLSIMVVWLALACDVGEPTTPPFSTITPVPTATSARTVTPVPTVPSVPAVTPLPTATLKPYSTITVTDSRGKDVVFDGAPQRIVSLSPAHTEILYALG